MGLRFRDMLRIPRTLPALFITAKNYTTLGYSDVVMSTCGDCLGPVEAADGMFMFAVSNAMIFAIIVGLIQALFRLERY
ncbi:MAG: hypothetical protein ACLQU2_16320 [Candidatus Binataceae bacterium]